MKAGTCSVVTSTPLMSPITTPDEHAENSATPTPASKKLGAKAIAKTVATSP
jgi:hypothetical protein